MKKLVINLFEMFGSLNVRQCCFLLSDEIEIPDELAE
ncbi:Staphylococcal AgrD protein [Listeria grayi]|nr:cyclic lactone autoinducer peptide [Listeria grayi]VEI31263.1 Staphylococcal AgrD protein [Listeria grayi]